ncbi:NASP-related protein sim3 [Momordica charantia]|uniref:NASP-related protein sim3 n=1 Tax=Momordica charantia TaxID=3673 RepID=A0A6J1E053_MOMCH|nr:NASP-related protein sim3 [Momordica charantia]
MADEGPPSEVSVTVDKPKVDESLNASEVTIESNAQGGVESSSNCSNDKNAATEATAQTSDGSGEKSLEMAEELLEKGSKAMKDNDFNEAVDCFSRALEIRAAHYGELAPECVKLYYKYGCALLYKAQEEADPLGAVPKKEGESHQESDKDGSVKSAVNGESSKASVSSNAELVDGVTDDVSSKKDQDEEDADNSDAEDLAEADEDESDLDLAWKMLDVARAIVEKDSGDTMEKVDILSALAEVALEREDIETSLSDYQKALSILERLVEPDNRQLAELNFRLCLCLEFGSKPQEAIPFCQKAISICKSRVLRLTDEVKSILVPTTASSTSGSEPAAQLSSNVSQIDTDNAASEKQSEIETLSGLLVELEKKLEDLQQLASNPKSILSEILGIGSARSKVNEKSAPPAALNSSQLASANSNGGFDSPTVSTAHTNGAPGVTHLGVVGRGVKRVSTNSESAESNPMKKPAIDSSSQDKGDGSSA